METKRQFNQNKWAAQSSSNCGIKGDGSSNISPEARKYDKQNGEKSAKSYEMFIREEKNFYCTTPIAELCISGCINQHCNKYVAPTDTKELKSLFIQLNRLDVPAIASAAACYSLIGLPIDPSLLFVKPATVASIIKYNEKLKIKGFENMQISQRGVLEKFIVSHQRGAVMPHSQESANLLKENFIDLTKDNRQYLEQDEDTQFDGKLAFDN